MRTGPAARHPALAIDDNINTKFLHFKGENQPTGFQVTPMMGPTVVTGLTFTTANDAAERDPVPFELHGSNTSIDGPYTLIASGAIADFAQATAWPRYTINSTPIAFTNTTAYLHYQTPVPAGAKRRERQQHANRRGGAAGLPGRGDCPPRSIRTSTEVPVDRHVRGHQRVQSDQ